MNISSYVLSTKCFDRLFNSLVDSIQIKKGKGIEDDREMDISKFSSSDDKAPDNI